MREALAYPMPCYSPWYLDLEPGTPSFESARREIEAIAAATRHVISTYLLLHRVRPPIAVETLPHGVDERALRPFDYEKLGFEMIHRIAQHCLCDDVHFTSLYDVRTVMPDEDPYHPVIADVAWALRAQLANKPFDGPAYRRAAKQTGGRPGHRVIGDRAR